MSPPRTNRQRHNHYYHLSQSRSNSSETERGGGGGSGVVGWGGRWHIRGRTCPTGRGVVEGGGWVGLGVVAAEGGWGGCGVSGYGGWHTSTVCTPPDLDTPPPPPPMVGGLVGEKA